MCSFPTSLGNLLKLLIATAFGFSSSEDEEACFRVSIKLIEKKEVSSYFLTKRKCSETVCKLSIKRFGSIWKRLENGLCALLALANSLRTLSRTFAESPLSVSRTLVSHTHYTVFLKLAIYERSGNSPRTF